MTITISRKIHFQNSYHTKKKICKGEKPKRPKARVQRISKLMAMAIVFNEMLRDGRARNMAELAKLGQVSRARMTQIMNLNLLAPSVQEKLLNLPKTKAAYDDVSLREMQKVVMEADWDEQQVVLVYGERSVIIPLGVFLLVAIVGVMTTHQATTAFSVFYYSAIR